MKIKTRLTLGIGLLFLLIVLLGIVGSWSTNALKKDTEKILIANYNSLQYCRLMLSGIEDGSPGSLNEFETSLRKQESNITEIGEKELTSGLRQTFDQFKVNRADTVLINGLRAGLYRIMDLNLQAIQRKSQVAKQTAERAVFWIALSSTLCFLVSFILLINLPSSIANPIRELTQSIRQIAAKKYSERVHFESHSEFGELASSFNTMAQKLEEYNNSSVAKLMLEKKRIETLINKIHDPVIGLDENLRVIFANEEAVKISGLPASVLIGSQAPELAKKNDLINTLIQDLTASEQNPGSKSSSLKIFSEGKENYFEKEIIHISITPTGEKEQNLVGHVLILRNVTSYKEKDFAKTNFIATVSHEFKTPISSIKLSVDLLKNSKVGSLNEEQNNLIENIGQDANRLQRITGELLNMTQVESGNIQLAVLPVDPREILEYAVNATKSQAVQKQINLEVNVADNLPRVLADSEKTAWVLINLVSNAIRYSYDNSSVFLTVNQKSGKVFFSVKDTGQGIPTQYKEKIFDRYFRVPGSKKEGTGLGLAISKEFIEAQGGNIAVESEFGVGSEFIVALNAIV